MTAQVDAPLTGFPFVNGGLSGGKVRNEQLEMGKVFVGGLSRDTTTNGLRVYFERFGDISDCVVMKDRSTGAPRGFGFVTYVSQLIADRVVLHRHVIDGKEVEAKHAVPRDSEVLLRPSAPSPPNGMQQPPALASPPVPASSASNGDMGSKKIFVGGLSHETGEEDFMQYFRSFGAVVDCVIMCDPHTRKPRGFGFITYDSIESVDRVCSSKFHDLNGKRVEVKRAIPQDRMLAGSEDASNCNEDAFTGSQSASSVHGRRNGAPFGAGSAYPRGSGNKQQQGGFNGQRVSTGGTSAWMSGGPPKGRAGPQAQESVTAVTALNAALSTANVVLSQGSELPPPAQEAGGEGLVNAAALGANPFMNLGGNFSSATTALNQGFRTTYGASAPAAFPQNQDEAQEPAAPAQAAAARAPVAAGSEAQLSPQALQEQLAHLQRQQNLLQQLQQQQLQLQIAQQKHTQEQLRLQLSHQMNKTQPPKQQSTQPDSQPSELVSTAQPQSQISHLPISGAATNAPTAATCGEASADISSQLAHFRFSQEHSSSNGDTGAASGGYCF